MCVLGMRQTFRNFVNISTIWWGHSIDVVVIVNVIRRRHSRKAFLYRSLSEINVSYHLRLNHMYLINLILLCLFCLLCLFVNLFCFCFCFCFRFFFFLLFLLGFFFLFVYFVFVFVAVVILHDSLKQFENWMNEWILFSYTK